MVSYNQQGKIFLRGADYMVKNVLIVEEGGQLAINFDALEKIADVSRVVEHVSAAKKAGVVFYDAYIQDDMLFLLYNVKHVRYALVFEVDRSLKKWVLVVCAPVDYAAEKLGVAL